MAHRLVKEHHVEAGNLAATEYIYRCDNDYGAIVYIEPPGSELADRMLITPVHFSSEDADSYTILSAEEATEGVSSGSLLRPKFIFSQAEADDVLDKLCAYSGDYKEGTDGTTYA